MPVIHLPVPDAARDAPAAILAQDPNVVARLAGMAPRRSLAMLSA